MKKRIAFTIAIALVFTLFAGSIAMASPAAPPADVAARKAARQAFLVEIKPLREEMAANREEIKELREQLEALRVQVKAKLEALRANPAGLSAEQIAQIQAITEQMKSVRQSFNASNPEMKQEKGVISNAKKLGRYAALKLAFQNIIRVQHLRIQVLKNLIALNNQLLALLNALTPLPSPSPAA